jgi:hypothetical protein
MGKSLVENDTASTEHTLPGTPGYRSAGGGTRVVVGVRIVIPFGWPVGSLTFLRQWLTCPWLLPFSKVFLDVRDPRFISWSVNISGICRTSRATLLRPDPATTKPHACFRVSITNWQTIKPSESARFCGQSLGR